MILIDKINCGYSRLNILKNISIHIKKGERAALIGVNGSGKTTLLKCISGLLKPTSGKIILDNQDTERLSIEEIVLSGCSLVPENRELFNSLTVSENLYLGAQPLKKRTNNNLVKKRTDYCYSIFPRLFDRKNQLAGTLSGGEQQMLAIARALMGDPKILLLDEPSTGLSPMMVKEIYKIISGLSREITLLLIEQNSNIAVNTVDTVYLMENGSIVMEGSADTLRNNEKIKKLYLGLKS